ncbi:FecR domain-containing protein [Iodobacter sp. CM08]|uniref:FecR domain-containing protein n=1 Tax=Iodobacter sp. CM08 TaxID=3085902 RepID=UPI00298162DD|nr:FecR domain-containing protein [Iodobacter sp. CM08]MDW5415624.1 FecR domain-containing protein [Iodobacter sp. CM08]
MRLAIIFGLLLSSFAYAEPARVESVQLPAWLERAGQKKPLAPNMLLLSADKIMTGAGARVYLQLPEGSRVKLGENVNMQVDQINEADGKNGSVFKAALKVVAGAFRFTTNALSKAAKREVNVSVSTVTAGIRGTDLWGKADVDKNVVCLLEGKIAVGAEGYPQVELNQPLSFYVAPLQGEPLPVGAVDPEKLKLWSAETEIEGQKGALIEKGGWRIVWGKYAKVGQALALFDRLQAAGYPVKIRSVRGQHRVQLTGLASAADAQAVVSKVHASLATPLAHISH